MTCFQSLFLLTLLVCFQVITAKMCEPGAVSKLSLTTTTKMLEWSAAENPNECQITGYIINVYDLDEGQHRQLQTSDTSYNLSAVLDMCKKYTLEVLAATDLGVQGPSESINITTPPEDNLDLTLQISDATEDPMTVSWTPQDSDSARCISTYRVVYWDEDHPTAPSDKYLDTTSFTLEENIVPCMDYTFQVNAIVRKPDIEGPSCEVVRVGAGTVPSPPTVVGKIVTTNSTVNMTWAVPSYANYHCTLDALILDTVGLSIENITIHDSSLRPNVEVYLSNLLPNTAYVSYVSLQSTEGYSKNVSVTFQTSDSLSLDYDYYYNY